ncbi:MAG: MBL fold metallo-hydrolase [Planctomycetes bacterium]|nr:MBL fold metallo-hydrolase [Planctomycetota bacterium]
MKITFHGAARSVTGSRHLLEINGHRILLDCGLFQGRREEANRRNSVFGFRPRDVHAIVLSHAHIDHSGAIPSLVRHGFAGRVYATPATADLADVMLRDSAFIHERDIEFVNKREGLTGRHAKQPLYTVADAEEAARRFERRPYWQTFEVADGLRVTFHEAGHILGSAMVRVEAQEKGRKLTIVFSGDLGRDALPIVRSPEQLAHADVLLLESTYGNRTHEPIADVEAEFANLVRRAVERKGKVLIPAFAVGRTQQLTYMLNNLFNGGRLPEAPVFVDSPLAADATGVFRRHADCYEKEMVERLRKHEDHDPFGFHLLRYLRTKEESKRLNDLDGPAIIIAASGMCEHGRILHHVASHAQNERNVVCFVGYQAEGTLGRRLVEGAKRVRIFGRDVDVRASVVRFDALSAHADRPGLEAYYRGFENRVRRLFVVHGEAEASEGLAAWARENSSAKVHVPELGESVEI